MKMKKIIILLLLPFALVGQNIDEIFYKKNEIYFSFQYDKKSQLNKLSKIISLDHKIEKTTAYAYANKKQFELFSSVAKYLIIEFVDKEDSQIQRLLQNREDVFDDYTEENFEMIVLKYFEMIDSIKIKNSHRKIYLLKNKTEEFLSKD